MSNNLSYCRQIWSTLHQGRHLVRFFWLVRNGQRMSEIQHGQTDLLVCARKGVNEVSFSFTFQLLLRFLSSLNVCLFEWVFKASKKYRRPLSMGLYCCGISEESSLSVLPQIDVKYGVQALKHRQSSGTHYSFSRCYNTRRASRHSEQNCFGNRS